jgi:ABC-2 type transport system permease protein
VPTVSELAAFGRFEVGRLLRSWKFLVITVGFPVIFYMLFLGDRSSGTVIGGTVPWRTYLMVSMCSFGALVAGLTAGGGRLSAERSSGWARQLRVTPIPSWSYLATKVTASLLVTLPIIVLVELVGATFGGVRLSAGTWVELTALMWVTTLPFALLGVLIGLTVNAETAFPVVTALMFVLGYFGGLFNPVSSMPPALQDTAHLLPSFHHAALGLSLLDGRGFGAEDWLVLALYALILGMAITWRHRSEESRGLA